MKLAGEARSHETDVVIIGKDSQAAEAAVGGNAAIG
jgi:hypothetical protein